MPQVETALGPIDVEDIGMCLMHEHIIIADWDMRSNYDDYVDIESEVPKAVGSLNKAKERGVKTIVDLTPVNLGRDIHSIQAVSKATGVNVICPTGFYWTEEPWMHGWDAEYLSKYMIRDITDGILDTGIKAGIIKCATDHTGVDDFNKKLLQATALARYQIRSRF